MFSISSSLTFLPVGYFRRSNLQVTFSPFAVVVLAMRLTIVSQSRNGSPRQLDVIKENSRCSILFHLLVPGGKWQTCSSRPVSSARRCSSVFHSRTLLPFEPPQSAVIVKRVVFG